MQIDVITVYENAEPLLLKKYWLILILIVLQITPGKRSPTVSQLDDGAGKIMKPLIFLVRHVPLSHVFLTWFTVAVQSLVLKKGASKIMDDLQEAGATDILLFSISNSRMWEKNVETKQKIRLLCYVMSTGLNASLRGAHIPRFSVVARAVTAITFFHRLEQYLLILLPF